MVCALAAEFLRRLTAKYSGLTLYDAENLYQDTFLAVHENIQSGRVREDTSWKSYIMTIGLNLAVRLGMILAVLILSMRFSKVLMMVWCPPLPARWRIF